MADLPDDLLEDVGKARVGGGGNYFVHGDYPIVMIDKWFYQKIQDRCIILETLVIESFKKIVYEGSKKVEEEPNAPGSTASSTANFDGNGAQSAASNSRAPVLGLYGFQENKVPDADIKKALSKALGDGQPMRGMLVAVTTFPKEIRSNKGNYITGLTWSCVAKPGTGINSPELAKARAAARDISAEKCLEVTLAQLKKFRADGALPGSENGKVTESGASIDTDAAPGIPDETPDLPEEKPDYLAKYVADGWKPHPKNPEAYYYRGKELKKISDIVAGL